MTTPSIVRTSTAELYDAHVLKNYARAPLTLVRGRGAQVWDDAGNAYLDFTSGIAVSALGQAIAQQRAARHQGGGQGGQQQGGRRAQTAGRQRGNWTHHGAQCAQSGPHFQAPAQAANPRAESRTPGPGAGADFRLAAAPGSGMGCTGRGRPGRFAGFGARTFPDPSWCPAPQAQAVQ